MSDAPHDRPQNGNALNVRDGLLFGLGAYLAWGLLPIYLKLISHVPALEILAHRILWSVPFGALLIALRGQWGEVRKAVTSPRVITMLGVTAFAISLNWLIYVWSVNNERILEASLGYYINPLMYVAAGVFILGEKLNTTQTVAVILAGLGVLVLTIGAGVIPWVSLSLATLFTLYGYLRKTTPVGAMPGLFIETSIVSPIAFGFLFWQLNAGNAQFLNSGLGTDALLLFAGPATVIPLVLFALAARRLHLSTLGLMQYLAPTMQFLLGLYFGEPFTTAHAICFGLIWTALAIFSFDAFSKNRRTNITKTV